MKKKFSIFLYLFFILVSSCAIASDVKSVIQKNKEIPGLIAITKATPVFIYKWVFGLPVSLLLSVPSVVETSVGKSWQNNSISFFASAVCFWGAIWITQRKLRDFLATRAQENKQYKIIKRAVNLLTQKEEEMKRQKVVKKPTSH